MKALHMLFAIFECAICYDTLCSAVSIGLNLFNDI